jgi:hypothetical protein
MFEPRTDRRSCRHAAPAFARSRPGLAPAPGRRMRCGRGFVFIPPRLATPSSPLTPRTRLYSVASFAQPFEERPRRCPGDVARRAGVSASTAPRALNGRGELPTGRAEPSPRARLCSSPRSSPGRFARRRPTRRFPSPDVSSPLTRRSRAPDDAARAGYRTPLMTATSPPNARSKRCRATRAPRGRAPHSTVGRSRAILK